MAGPQKCSTKQDFDSALQSAGNKLVVVDFTASWCGPCRMIAPTFDGLAKRFANSVFLKVDVDENPAVARAYSVSAMPTFVFIRNKSVIETLRGAQPSQLSSLVEKHSSSSGSGGSTFSGQGQTLSGGSRAPARVNPFGDDDSEEEEGATTEDALDPEVSAYLASQQAAKLTDADAERMREERIKAGGAKNTKSRYQREREEAERKRIEQESEAAEAYKEFVAAMEGDSAKKSGPAASNKKALCFVSSGGATSYNPSRQPAQQPPPSGPPSAPRAMRPPQPPAAAPSTSKGSAFGENTDDEDEAESSAKRSRREVPGRKKGAMGSFLGELQRQQAQREERLKDRVVDGKSVSSLLAQEGQQVGSRDFGDPLTTNVCVLNLPANINERVLGEFFAQWGDLGTVKIMWPRGEDMVGGAGAGITALRNTRSAGLTGFVCYMQRVDAEYAMKEADGISWGGCTLRTSWGKAMPKTQRPMYRMPSGSEKTRGKRKSTSPGRDDTSEAREAGYKRRRSPDSQRPHRRALRAPSPRTSIVQEMATSPEAQLIQGVAQRVRDYGPSFEALVRDKEQNNPRFDWLRDDSCLGAEYYRVLVDDAYIPKQANKTFEDAGYASLYDTDSGEESENERLKRQRTTDTLGRRSKERLEAMLRCLTLRRERIARATAFALEHANAAEEVTEVLIQSLLIPATPIPRKLARLYVVSDVLHNSAAPIPNAWKYRSALESGIQVVFRHLRDITKSFPGIMKQEGFRTQLRAVLDVWDSWLVFAPSTLEELRSTLVGGAVTRSAFDDGDEEDHHVKADDEKIQIQISGSAQNRISSAGAEGNFVQLDSRSRGTASTPDLGAKVGADRDHDPADDDDVDGEALDKDVGQQQQQQEKAEEEDIDGDAF